MTPENDLVEFNRRIVAFGEMFDVKFSASRMELYFEALADLPFTEVCRAMNIAARRCTFLPKPAELRAIILGDEEDLIEGAWVVFREAMTRIGSYASVITMDHALGDAVRTIFGSWPAACALELSPEMWAAKRKEWGRVYSLLRRRATPHPAYLVGLIESQNAGRADWAKYTTVALIDGHHVRELAAADVPTYRALLPAAPVHDLTTLRELVSSVAVEGDGL